MNMLIYPVFLTKNIGIIRLAYDEMFIALEYNFVQVKRRSFALPVSNHSNNSGVAQYNIVHVEQFITVFQQKSLFYF